MSVKLDMSVRFVFEDNSLDIDLIAGVICARLERKDAIVTYEPGDQIGFSLFLKDIAAILFTVANLEGRLSRPVYIEHERLQFHNEISTPFEVRFEKLCVRVYFQPKSSDRLPVAMQISRGGILFFTLRSMPESVKALAIQLLELMERYEEDLAKTE